MKTIIFDIETGPLADNELNKFFKEPDAFDEEAIKREFVTARDGSPKAIEFINKKRADHEAKAEQSYLDFKAKAALRPETGQILAIGYVSEDNEVEITHASEDLILLDFWSRFRQAETAGQTLAGWNIADFDVPFIIRRSWKHRIKIPRFLFENNRYLTTTFLDLMKLYGCHVYGERTSLDSAGLHLLHKGKRDQLVTGATFAKFFNGSEADRALALKYLENDLLLTKEIHDTLC